MKAADAEVLGKDHALSGALAFTAAAAPLHITGTHLLAGAVLAAGAGVLPDLDEPGSTIARSYGFLTEAAARAVHRASGGHRHGTHSLAGVAVFTAAAYAATLFDATLPGKIALGVALALLLSAALRAVHVGGHHGDALGIAAAAAMIYWHTGLVLAPLSIGIGAAAHIAGDMLTHSGCPLAWPASMHEFHLLPGPLRFTTNKLAEHWIVSPLLVIALGLLVWRDTGFAHTLPPLAR